MPSARAAAEARRSARASAESSLAIPGTVSSRAVVPAGTAPPACPAAASGIAVRERTRGGAPSGAAEGRDAAAGAGEEGAVEDDATPDVEANAAATARTPRVMPAARRPPARDRGVADDGGVRDMPRENTAGRCHHVCAFRYVRDMRRP